MSERDLFTPFEELDKRARKHFSAIQTMFHNVGEDPKGWRVPPKTLEESKEKIDNEIRDWITRFGAAACRPTITSAKKSLPAITKNNPVRGARDQYLIESFDRQAGLPYTDPV